MRSAWVALVLFIVPAVSAELGTAEVTAQLPVEAMGSVTLSAQDAWFVLGDDAAATQVAATVTDGELVRVIHRAFGYVRPDDPRLDITWHSDVEEKTTQLTGATLRLAEARDGFRLVVKDAAATLTPSDDTLLLGILDAPRHIQAGWDAQVSLQIDPPAPAYVHELAKGLHQSHVHGGRAAASGAFELYLSNALVVLDGASILQAHFREETRPGGLYDPLQQQWFGPGTHTEYVQEHLLLRVDAGRLDVAFEEAGLLVAARPHLDVLGTALLPAATGTVTVGDETHTLRAADLELAGRFRLDALGTTDGRTAFEGNGDFTGVSYGAVAAAYDWATPLVVAGIGTLILAGAAWLVSQSKALAPLGGLALYARVHGEEVLEHPARAELYERIKAHPGTHFQEISDDVDFGASTLNYHLRVLEKNDYITRLKDGRYVRFFDRRTGAYAGARKHAMSALRNQTTAAIAKEILRNPGVAQCDLAQRFAIAASTVNWHVRRLADAGLVEKHRDHHYTRYYGGPAWAQLPGAEQARWLTA